METIASLELAATWAREAFVAKNRLTASDAKLIEAAFERRLAELPSPELTTPPNDDRSVTALAQPQQAITAQPADPDQARGIDKGVLAIATPRRLLTCSPNSDRVAIGFASPPYRKPMVANALTSGACHHTWSIQLHD